MLCYIYDGDYWGYYFYDKGMVLDCFNTMPDYFVKISEEERQRLAGNSKIIAAYFDVEEAEIKNDIQIWTDDILDSEDEIYAYSEDEFCMGENWQMADFMRKIGYLYQW